MAKRKLNRADHRRSATKALKTCKKRIQSIIGHIQRIPPEHRGAELSDLLWEVAQRNIDDIPYAPEEPSPVMAVVAVEEESAEEAAANDRDVRDARKREHRRRVAEEAKARLEDAVEALRQADAEIQRMDAETQDWTLETVAAALIGDLRTHGLADDVQSARLRTVPPSDLVRDRAFVKCVRMFSLKFHPDKAGHDDVTRVLQRFNARHDVLRTLSGRDRDAERARIAELRGRVERARAHEAHCRRLAAAMGVAPSPCSSAGGSVAGAPADSW